MSSSQSVFIPELLIIISSFLRLDHKSLLSAALVNHYWFHWMTDVMWESPKPAFFEKVEKPRRQIYASKVKYLDLSTNLVALHMGGKNIYNHEALVGLNFPRLRELTLDLASYDKDVEQYLHRPLHKIVLKHVPLTPWFLERMSSRCPKLREIKVQGGKLGTANTFIRFLRSCGSIDCLCWDNRDSTKETEDAILVYLAGRGNLRRLATYSDFSFESGVFKHILENVPTPFPKLSFLGLNILAEAVPYLLRCIRPGELQSLAVSCTGNINSHLSRLSKVTSLRHLCVAFTHSPAASAADILSLRNLVLLESLIIIDRAESPEMSDIKDSDFDQLVSRLPNVTHFGFDIKCNLSGRALEILSKRCPSLQKCRLIGLTERQHFPPHITFPDLKQLAVEAFHEHDFGNDSVPIDSAVDFAERFHRQCPKLKDFWYKEDEDVWGSQFKRSFEELTRNNT